MLKDDIVGALVEIALDSDGELPRDLIATAYIASRAITVGFVLDAGVTREEVDRVLDPLVATTCGSVRGVRYLDHNDDRGVLAAIGRARFVVAVTRGFRERCARSGIASLEWPAALSEFENSAPQRTSPGGHLRTGSELQSASLRGQPSR